MIRIDSKITPKSLLGATDQLFALSARKIARLEKTWNPAKGTPVFTVEGRYTSRGWTEWTQGFQFGSAILQFDATDDAAHAGDRPAHDACSTWPAMSVTSACTTTASTTSPPTATSAASHARAAPTRTSGRSPFYELALKVSGAVQAARWTDLPDGLGYIYSFNGPHSLFADTMRSLRSLAWRTSSGTCSWASAIGRSRCCTGWCSTPTPTRAYNVYFGKGRDALRRPRTGGARIRVQPERRRVPLPVEPAGVLAVHHLDARPRLGAARLRRGARVPRDTRRRRSSPPSASASARCSGATSTPRAPPRLLHRAHADVRRAVLGHRRPGLAQLGDYLDRPADPYNDHEPVDSSAAAIAAQGLIRLGTYLDRPRRRGRRQALPGGRPHRVTHAVLRAVPLDRPEAPGPAAARGLPPPERLGPHPDGPQDPLRRVVHVGRLPRPRTRAPHPPHGEARAVLHVLRGLRSYLPTAIGTRTSVRIQRSTMSAPEAVFSNSKVSWSTSLSAGSWVAGAETVSTSVGARFDRRERVVGEDADAVEAESRVEVHLPGSGRRRREQRVGARRKLLSRHHDVAGHRDLAGLVGASPPALAVGHDGAALLGAEDVVAPALVRPAVDDADVGIAKRDARDAQRTGPPRGMQVLRQTRRAGLPTPRRTRPRRSCVAGACVPLLRAPATRRGRVAGNMSDCIALIAHREWEGTTSDATLQPSE